MWTLVGAGSLQSAPVLALKRMLPAPKRLLRGRGVATLDWSDALRTNLTVSGSVDSLAGGKQGPCLAGEAGTVDTERMGGVATSHNRLLKDPFRTAVISTSVGGAMMEESADRATLCLFFA